MGGGSVRPPGFAAPVRALVAALSALAFVVPLGSLASAGQAEWNIAKIGAPATSSDVVIAVVDTGVDGTHPAFGGRVLPQLDFTGDGERGDPEGHGTHVAGTAVGGSIDCGGGPSAIGVAPNARVLPVRVLDAEGSGSVKDVVAGIRAAADRGATVINLSLGGDLSFLDGGGNDFRDAVTYAWEKGSIPVLAAGNDGLLGSVFADGYKDFDAVVVTATTSADRKAGYASSVGSAKWGISAPGGDGSGRLGQDVRSAYPDSQCGVLGGTSMAAPHVSGALAVLRSKGLDPSQAIDRLLATAAPIGSKDTYGAGLVDVAAATQGLNRSSTSVPVEPTTTVGTTPTATADPGPGPVASGSPTTEPASGAPPSDTTDASSTTVAVSPTEPSPTVDTDPTPTTLDPAPGSGEVAGRIGPDIDDGDRAGQGLVAVAVVGCAAAWASALWLRRLKRQP